MDGLKAPGSSQSQPNVAEHEVAGRLGQSAHQSQADGIEQGEWTWKSSEGRAHCQEDPMSPKPSHGSAFLGNFQTAIAERKRTLRPRYSRPWALTV